MTSHRLVETTPAASEPLSLPDVKAHLRVDAAADDALISSLITTARSLCEIHTGRALITRSYSLYLDQWPDKGVVSLPRPPLQTVSEILIHAEDDTSQTYPAENYFVDTSGLSGRVVLKNGAPAPWTTRTTNGIEIRFDAGYGVASATVPPLLRQGMLQMIAYLYMHRGDDAAGALQSSGAAFLFQSYRVMGLT